MFLVEIAFACEPAILHIRFPAVNRDFRRETPDAPAHALRSFHLKGLFGCRRKAKRRLVPMQEPSVENHVP